MVTWIDIVQNYIIKYCDRIQKATRPLREHFGIDYFTYHRIDDQGRYTVLVDRPDWAEYYVENKIYLNDPLLEASFHVCLWHQLNRRSQHARVPPNADGRR